MSTLRVDKIEPYLSSSIDIVGYTAAAGGATTGSNDFIGNQTVTGSIDITGEFLVNGSPITGSGGGSINTASLATTGSNVFVGDQNINNGYLHVSSSGGAEFKVNNDGSIDAESILGFNIVGDVSIVGASLDIDGEITASAINTSQFNSPAGLLNISAGSGAILFMGGNKLEVSGSIEANGNIIANNIDGNTISGQAVSASNGFSGDGSGLTNVDATTLDGQDSTAFAVLSGGNTYDATQTVTNGSGNSSNVTPVIVSNVDTSGGMGQTKNISISANPSSLGGPLSAWTEPTLYSLGSSGPYRIAEFQSQGNYTDGTATFKVPLVVSGSIIVTGDVTAPNITGSGGGSIDTGSFATTGSNEFDGKQGVTGSVEVSGSIIVTGSVYITGSATFVNNGPSTFNGDTVISTIDSLPGGQPGQIAFQGGKMWVYISGQWNEVSFVSAPPPSSYEFSMVYNDTSAAGACGGGSPNPFYSDSATLVTGSALYTGPGLASAVSDGFYASASFAYEVSGGSGVISAITECPPSYYTFSLAFSAADAATACSNFPGSASDFYSGQDSLGIGNTIYTDTALTSVASNNTWYSDGTLWYYQTGDAIDSSDNC